MNERRPTQEQVDLRDVIQSLVTIVPHLVAETFRHLVARRLLTPEEAAAALLSQADLIERINLASPLVGEAIAKTFRDFAGAFADATKPVAVTLTLIKGDFDSGDGESE